MSAAQCSSAVSPVLPVVVRDILARNDEEAIKLVLFPGDLITGGLPREASSVAECNRTSLGQWRETMNPLQNKGILLRITAGNHEILSTDPLVAAVRCGKSSWPYTPDLQSFRVFREAMDDLMEGNKGPDSDLGLTYSFDLDSCHFVLLTAYTLFENNSFSNETITWLEKDLAEAERTGKKIFVASHPPAFPGGGHMWDSLPYFDPTYSCQGYDGRFGIDRRTERDRFWNILKKYNVVAYFCGHEHLLQVQEVDGVWHVVSGGLTPKLYHLNGADVDTKRNTILYDGKFQNPRASVNWPWDDGRKSYWGWSLVTVEGDQVKLDVFGSETLPRTPADLKLLKSFVLRQ
ncbi:MAG TPA: metallophosphoesterase [Desulfomonilaceae bacterium]|nr:metallophosphoesterase [Desulfomonilaceae bacterium]